MPKPLVFVVPEEALAHTLGSDFRWPVCAEVEHARVLITQGFSVISLTHPGHEVEADFVELDDLTDAGAAHQLIAASGHDPLKLNVDMGTFAWVQDGAGRLLLVRHDYGPRAWGLPGGTLSIGEPPDKAVVREVREETGYDVRVERLLALYGRRQHIGIYFACNVIGGEERTEFDTEVAEVGWFEPEEPPQPISPVIGLLRADMAGGHAAARFF